MSGLRYICRDFDIYVGTSIYILRLIEDGRLIEGRFCIENYFLFLITFYFFINLFQDSSQPIQLQYFLWIYPEQVVAELTRVTYVAEINKSSPSRAIWGCLLDSSRFFVVDSSSSQ